MSTVLWGHKNARICTRKASHWSFIWVEVLKICFNFSTTYFPMLLCQHSQWASHLGSLILLISPDFKYRRISYSYSNILRSLEQMEQRLLLQMLHHMAHSKQLLCLLIMEWLNQHPWCWLSHSMLTLAFIEGLGFSQSGAGSLWSRRWQGCVVSAPQASSVTSARIWQGHSVESRGNTHNQTVGRTQLYPNLYNWVLYWVSQG